MTRYARAVGSKSSNARLPADPTPWSEMAPVKATKKAESDTNEVSTPKKEPKVVQLRSGTPKTPTAAQLMSPPTSAVSSAKRLSRKTPLNVRATLNSSIMNTPDNLLTPKAGKMSDPSPLQTRSARKKKAELAALEGTPVKGATPAKGTPAKAVAAKKLNPTKSATKKTAKAAKTEDSEDTELCLKLEEDGMDSDDLDSDDDEDNAQGNGAEVDQAAIEKLLSEAKNAKTILSHVKNMEASSPKPSAGILPKTPTRGTLKTPSKVKASATSTEVVTPAKEAKTPKKGAQVTPVEESTNVEIPTEEVAPKTPLKTVKAATAKKAKATPAKATPAKATPAKAAAAKATPAKAAPVETTPAETSPVKPKTEPVEVKKEVEVAPVASETPVKVEPAAKSTEEETAMETEVLKETSDPDAPKKKKRKVNTKNKEKTSEFRIEKLSGEPGNNNLISMDDVQEDTMEKKWNPSEKITVSQANEERFNKIRENLLASGKPVDQVEQELKKIRRSMLKRLAHTRCLRCRHRGHMQKDCPEKAKVVAKCFKCGKADHISRNCTIKAEVYTYAECFICHQVGHLTKTCPSNDNGIYPRGGSCYKCNEKTHLARDCPTLEKAAQDENVEPKVKAVLVGTLDNKLSGDADVVADDVKPVAAKKGKRKSVVKF